MGVNAAGLNSKMTTFKKIISDLNPTIFFIEETKFKETGKLKALNYIVFEKVRDNCTGGGGIALGCVKDLHPALVREGKDGIEALSIEIFLKNIKIRCVVAYGPQENEIIEKKNAFWQFLDEEVHNAKMSGSAFILQFDGNLWAGNQIIPGDPRTQNKNGMFFKSFLERNNLIVVNSQPVCEGLITRKRFKNGVQEKSILDFFVVCSSILPYVTKMVIDEKKQYILTNYRPAKKNGRAIDSDHMTLYMDINIEYETIKPERQEIFNFKESEGQQIFKKLTTETKKYSECFDENNSFLDQVENWRSQLFYDIKKSFKKIRIRNKIKKPINLNIKNLINKRNTLMSKRETFCNLKEWEDEIEQINTKIAEFESEQIRNEILKRFAVFSQNPENINLTCMWKLLKKISPKVKPSMPTAKRNNKGEIITGPNEIKKLLAKEYENRLRLRPIRPGLEEMKSRKLLLFNHKLKFAENIKAANWTIKDLNKALADLKNEKSRDSEGLINEIFKDGVIGNDLKHSLLMMFNKMKAESIIPSFLKFANITTVPKSGSQLDPVNERGIFRVSVVRSIIMRMIYNDKYKVIDENMSECQMGGRKNKGCKSNIWIVNGIIHEISKSKNIKPIQLQIYDYKQMFDSMDLKEAISDIFDVGVRDNDLSLIYKANKQIEMAVKTPNGLTNRQSIKNSVLQGDTWSSIMASVQVDAICKDVEKAGLGFRYKNSLEISALALVDDIICVTEAGFKAAEMNAVINAKTAEKHLQFGILKCKSMYVGKDIFRSVLDTELYVDKWKVEYLEDKDTSEEKLIETFEGPIPIGKVSAQKYLGFVISATGDNMENIKAVKKRSYGTIQKLLTKLESLKLRNYYFECSLLFLNVMLRPSILYACETYYNLTEPQIRQLERIEEQFLRKVFKTSKSCPIVQLYLEAGHIPARFEIKRMRLLFLKNILQQKPSSMIYNFFQLQVSNPTRGDWASACLKDLKELRIYESLPEIQEMNKTKFNKLLKERIKENALSYLLKKQGTKGKDILYKNIEMADYLQPYSKISIEEKQKIFEMRNKMTQIPNNYLNGEKKVKCVCDMIEDMSHIYECRILNTGNETKIEYGEIYRENIVKQIEILRIFENNLEKRRKMQNIGIEERKEKRKGEKRIFPCDLLKDPLNCKRFRYG